MTLNEESPSLDQKVERLLSEMTLEEKIGQLRAEWLMPWAQLFKLFNAAPKDKREKLTDFMFSMFFGEREVSGAITSAYVREHLGEFLEKAKNAGMLSIILCSFPPREAAELHNRSKNSSLKTLGLRFRR
ncbi:MAG: hypothetical protein RMJ15_08985 [Nitrososphaerota archaeon]|nr:hypothetical protein [Candidatus Bathyarchaeota archaeon]MDW8023851.1 hypothetical protein [Nitrososphaerota archaeon]